MKTISIDKKLNSKTIGSGGGGKCRVYYSEKFKRKVVEKTVGDNFLRTKEENRTRLKTLMTNYKSNEILLGKEMIFMLLTKIAKLDCCVEILDFASDPFRIIMEYCEGGDIRKILDRYEVPVSDKLAMISQILLALKRIHENGFIHGDLKCANIFLVNKYTPGDYKNIKIKIGDFGLSEIGGDLVFGGTPGFMAPEVPLIGGSFDSDIYSIGKVMLEIMTQLPIQMIQVINSSNIYSLKDKLPKFMDITQFYDIVISCLNIDYKKRPSADKLFKLFHSLITLWLFGEDTNILILMKYRLGESVPVDTHPHPLILSNGEMRQYQGEGWYCDICQNDEHCFFDNMFSFHCKKCKYDLCKSCIEKHDYRVVNDKMIKRVPKGKKVYVNKHPHYLLLSGKNDRSTGDNYSWNCDICKVVACDSVYSFHCKKCGYDVCSKCFETYFEIREKEDGCCFIF
jgi:serine/threonine protein kinase